MFDWDAALQAAVPRHFAMAAREAVRALRAELQTVPDSEGRPQLYALFERVAQAVRDQEERYVAAKARAERLAVPLSERERRDGLAREILADYPRTALGDLRALKRHLDAEALAERDHRCVHAARQRCEALFFLLTWLVARDEALDAVSLSGIDGVHDVEVGLLPLLRLLQRRHHPWSVRAGACALMAAGGCRWPRWATRCRQTLWRQACDVDDDAWVQVAALEAYVRIRAHGGMPVDAALGAVLLPTPPVRAHLPADHAFVRARAAGLAVQYGCWTVAAEVRANVEPSEHVRQALVRALATDGRREAVEVLQARLTDTELEPSALVRAAAVDALLQTGRTAGRELSLINAGLHDSAPLVLQAAVAGLLQRLAQEGLRDWALAVAQCCKPRLNQLAAHADADLRHQAARVLNALAIAACPQAWAVAETLRAKVATAREGQRLRLSTEAVRRLAPEMWATVLAAVAADGFDLSARPGRQGGMEVQVGTRPHLAWWRIGHELTHPAPDKRQAFRHTQDQRHPWPLVALSSHLSEVTATRVAGQRVAGPNTLDWGAALPLPQALVAAARHGESRWLNAEHDLRLRTTSQGGRWRRWRQRLRAQRHYVRLDALRRRLHVQGGDNPVGQYDTALRALGFAVERRKPPWLAAMLPAPETWTRAFLREDNNTVGQLWVLSLALASAAMLRNLWLTAQIRSWRRALPLCIGGWGSRGKSGTERIKAGLFHGLGYRVVSKTTGCEAMIVVSAAAGGLKEVFLFRPFDKATIWEQRDVLATAAELEAQVFLWECMALNPNYVEILQHDWMRDDIATLTNTYPDHEDIQGPSGRDVADVIARFIPQRKVLLSSEMHMTPVLRQQAERVRTAMHSVRWADWALLPPELLQRFPYAEHPKNIALVLSLGAHLDVPHDVALKLMADHVVADIGVLKDYGPATLRERRLRFINGMSANERAGFLSNWKRMHFDQQSDASGLAECVVVLLNNRADRLARQEVFARIAAQDCPADALVVIGSNVGAFAERYHALVQAEEAQWRARWHQATEAATRRSLAEEMAARWRRPLLAPEAATGVVQRWCPRLATEDVQRWVERAYASPCLAESPVPDEDTPAAWCQTWLGEVGWLWQVAHSDAVAMPPDAIVGPWLMQRRRRLHMLSDPAISGDAIITAVSACCPPHTEVRILGAENIKGPGLNCVYRWMSIDQVGRWLADLRSARPQTVRAAMAALSRHRDYGRLDGEQVRTALSDAATQARLRMFGAASELENLLTRLAQDQTASARSAVKRHNWLQRAMARLQRGLESLLDAFDSVRRRWQADQLYADLARGRVGIDRAALVAKGIQMRQKGGWLRRTR